MKTSSERFLLLLLAAVQFTHIMDFMILMPLGPQLMREFDAGPQAFSWLVSAYTVSAGVIGFLSVFFVDRFDRRTLLLWVYAGFVLGTGACAVSHSHSALLLARVVCGAFGGVSGALVLAMIGDLVPPERRASGIGIVMTAFSAAAALGVPFGLYLAQRFNWEAPFWLLAGLAALTWLALWRWMPSLRGHLSAEHKAVSLRPLLEHLGDPNALRALAFMAALIFGHFTIIPLLTPYLVANVGLAEKHVFLVYLVGGVLTIFTSPRIGRLADRRGRVPVYAGLVGIASLVTLAITHSGPLPLWVVLLQGAGFFVFASGRFVPGQALMTLAVPPQRRGSFMSLTSCVRDLMAGVTSAVGGWVVIKGPTGELLHYDRLGWLAVTAGLLSVWLATRVTNAEAAAQLSAAQPAQA